MARFSQFPPSSDVAENTLEEIALVAGRGGAMLIDAANRATVGCCPTSRTRLRYSFLQRKLGFIVPPGDVRQKGPVETSYRFFEALHRHKRDTFVKCKTFGLPSRQTDCLPAAMYPWRKK